MKKNQLMNEKQVKKKFKVKEFSDLTKKKSIEFLRNIGSYTEEASIKALDTSKEVVNSIKEFLLDIKKSYDFALKTSDESHKEINANHTKMIDSLIDMINRDNLSFEEKKYFIEKYKEIQIMQNEKDSEHLKHKKKLANGVFKTVIGIGAVAIGGMIAFSKKK